MKTIYYITILLLIIAGYTIHTQNKQLELQKARCEQNIVQLMGEVEALRER